MQPCLLLKPLLLHVGAREAKGTPASNSKPQAVRPKLQPPALNQKTAKVKGVALYVSDFQRPITERLQKNFFSDPTQARTLGFRV